MKLTTIAGFFISMGSSRPARNARARTGSIGVLAAVLLPIVISLVALGIEAGMLCAVRTDLQRTADAAALAAAQELGGDDQDAAMYDARVVAQQYVARNPVLRSLPVQFDPQSDVVFGKARINDETQRVDFTPGETPATAVRVTVHYQLQYTFARIFGKTSKMVSATAVAAGRPRDYMVVIDLSGSMTFDTVEAQVAEDLINLNIVPPGYFDGPNAPDPEQVAYSLTYDGEDPQFQGVYAVGERYLPPSIRSQPLKASKEAAAQSLDVIEELGVYELAGAVAYSTGVVWVKPLTDTFDSVKAKLLGATKQSGTAIHAGLSAARQELQSARSRPLADRVMVLMTDGQSDKTKAINEAQLAAAAGITIHCIGLGTGVDYYLMDAIAEIGRGRAIYVSDTSNPSTCSAMLDEAFRSIATESMRVTLIE